MCMNTKCDNIAQLQLPTLFEKIIVNIQHNEAGLQLAFANLDGTVTQKHCNNNN